MSADWPVITLEQIIEHQKGFAFKSKDYIGEGTPVIRVSNFTLDSVDISDLKYVDESIASKQKAVSLETGDVVIATVGSWPTNPASVVGKTVCIPEVANNSLLNQNAVRLRVKSGHQQDQVFLYYLLKNKNFSDYIVSTAQGSANQASITLKDIFGYEFHYPEGPSRASIGGVLKSIDDKIALNTQTNQTLEQMAQALFKSWFVDFEPVKAKLKTLEAGGSAEQATLTAMTAISGKSADELAQLEASSPEQYAELKATAELFPAALQESELGQIPEGWEVGSLGEIASAKGGYAFKSKQFIDEGNPVIKIKNITSAGTVNTSDCQCIDDDIANTASRFKLSDGDLLMAMTGATVGKSGIYVSDGRDAYLNQRVAKFESKVDSSSPCWFTYNLVNKDSIFEQVVGAAQGSAQPNISSKGIEQIKTVVPPFELIKEYQRVVYPFYSKWISSYRECSQLASLRDTLLPKLLSGELTLPEAEQQVEVSQ
ncbi:restriction endonuclease subunit S [Dongshaea marina]|uniref:restriction endonuclease subunit S n=1 Tax=Dongshaea marina TaxID=2047966 RepID=UPI000D3E1220|nr:restriction endonuclease subunit S [Dongshaea marina]